MTDARPGQPPRSEVIDPVPCALILVAAPTKNAAPKIDDMVAEGRQGGPVVGHAVVLEISAHHTGQPLALFGNGCMHPPSKLLLDGLKLGPHPVATRTPPDLETPRAGASTDVGKAEEVKGFRFAKPMGFALGRRKAAKLDQSGLVRMERQGVFRHALFEVRQKPYGLGATLEPHDGVVGVSHDDHLASGVACSPLLDPEVENIVEIDVGQQRRDDRPLRGAHHRRGADPVLQHTHCQPFADQAEDPLVANPPFQETEQSVMAYRVKERPDIGVQDPVYLAGLNRHDQRVERVVLPPPRPKPVREPEEVLLVDRVQNFDQRPLDDLVLQGGNPQWPLAAVGFWDVVAPRRLCPVRSAMNAPVQLGQSGFQPVAVCRPGDLIHPHRRIPLELVVSPTQQIDVEVVQQRGEPRLLSCSCRLPYAVQSGGHARPARRPVRVGLARVPLGPLPSLPLLRPRLPGFVRRVLRYYGEARLLRFVHRRLQPLRPSRRGPARRQAARPNRRSPRFRRDPFLRDVVFDHGRATAPRIPVPHVLPSTLLTASASATFELSRLDRTPRRIAVYASCPPSPTNTQHSLSGARYGLPVPVFHRLDRASFSWRTSNLDRQAT